MKILHIVCDFEPKWGGIWHSVSGLLTAVQRKADCHIFATSREKNSSSVSLKGIPETRFETNWKYQFSWGIKSKIETLAPQFDLIHIHGLWQFPVSYGALQAKRNRIPYIYQVHGMLQEEALSHHAMRKQIYASLWERNNLNHAESVICLSPREEKNVRKFGVTAPTEVIPNAVSTSLFETLPPKGKFISRHPELSGKFLISFLGRIDPRKGIRLLLEAFSEFKHYDPKAHLLLAGPQENKVFVHQLEKEIAARDLKSSVSILGGIYDEEKKEFLVDSNVFVLPSETEAFSMALLEAMACGIPVIATRQSAFEDLYAKEAGILIHYDKKELVEAMIRLSSDEWLAKRTGISARNLALSKYNWDLVGERVLNLYQKILARR